MQQPIRPAATSAIRSLVWIVSAGVLILVLLPAILSLEAGSH